MLESFSLYVKVSYDYSDFIYLLLGSRTSYTPLSNMWEKMLKNESAHHSYSQQSCDYILLFHFCFIYPVVVKNCEQIFYGFPAIYPFSEIF